MRCILSFAVLSSTALTFATPYPPTNIPLHSLYHYCSPPTDVFTSHSAASSLVSSFCATAASTYHPNVHGEVETSQDDGLLLRAWWDATETMKMTFEDECVEAAERVVWGCRHEGDEERFYGGVSEYRGISGKVEIGFDRKG